jgi:4-amino-4-deoxy-L-arabinose transferase-like glycosyltransferase
MTQISSNLKNEKFYIAAILFISFVLNFWSLNSIGFGNIYYAAGIKNMLKSFSNFFYLSSDAGFVSLDKPPLGIWIDAISAKIFGFSGYSILLPHIISAVLSVWLMYWIVKKSFGSVTGLLSALILCLSAINISINRINTPDSHLILFLLIAVYFFQKSLIENKLKFLLLSSFFVGLGFNIKMLQAYLILPALFLTYIFFRKKLSWFTTFKNLFYSSLVLIIVSFLWIAAVDFTPASNRPFVGSSTNNTALDLAISYNGLQRFFGGYDSSDKSKSPEPAKNPNSNIVINRGPGVPSKVDPIVMGIGEKGIFRLFGQELGSQIGFLLLPSILILAYCIFEIYKKREFSSNEVQVAMIVFWGIWLITTSVFFSFAMVFHEYYLSMIVPPISILVALLFTQFKNKILNSVVVASTIVVQIWILRDYSEFFNLIPIIILLALIGIVLNFVSKLSRFGLVLAFISILVVPSAWAINTAMSGGEDYIAPIAGPKNTKIKNKKSPQIVGFAPGAVAADRAALEKSTFKLLNYLQANKGVNNYLVAVTSNREAGQLILNSNELIINLGGLIGNDRVSNLPKLQELVSSKQLSFVLLGSEGGLTPNNLFSGDPNKNRDIFEWVKLTCKPVEKTIWKDSESSKDRNVEAITGESLYKC